MCVNVFEVNVRDRKRERQGQREKTGKGERDLLQILRILGND